MLYAYEASRDYDPSPQLERIQAARWSSRYVGWSGLRGVDACVAQMRRHAENHDRALFVVYVAEDADVDLAHMSSGLRRNASLVLTSGPPIAPVRGAA